MNLMLVALFSSSPKVVEERYTATITEYNSEIDQTDADPFIAANGHPVFDGLIARSRAIPFGSIVTYNGNQYTCGDRMAGRFDDAVNLAMTKPHFDIWMPSHSAAINFGKKTAEVSVKVYLD